MLGLASPFWAQPPKDGQRTGCFEAAGLAEDQAAPQSPTSPGMGGSPQALRTGANSERAELLEAQGRGQSSSSGTMLPLTGHVFCHFLSIKWAWHAYHPHVTTGDSETLWLMGRARI